jgi:hypothetical protein
LHGKEGLRIGNGRRHLEPVAHDAGVGQQRRLFARAVAGDQCRVEAVVHFAIVFALAQDGRPAQPGLGTLKDEELEPPVVVVYRHAPFGVVVGDVEFGTSVRPAAALHRDYSPLFLGEGLPAVQNRCARPG